jgi:hypothetical protein
MKPEERDCVNFRVGFGVNYLTSVSKFSFRVHLEEQ